MSHLNQLSAKQTAELIQQKKISAVEVAQIYLQQIETVNPQLNAIVQQTDPEQVIAQAKQADAKLANGEILGKLHGVPVTVKDMCNVKGFVSAAGCIGYRQHRPHEDATVVARLRTAGAIILGVTNVPEFMATFETDNDLYGRTNNPYDLNRTPGGSSGGEAAIIAACGSALGLGSDAAGSIRQPAHNTGIAGLKPTKGLIPFTGNIPSDGAGLIADVATYGPMARFVEDLIYTLPIIAGADEVDPDAVPVPLQNPTQVNFKNLRVAFYTDNKIAPTTSTIQKLIIDAAQMLAPEVAVMEEALPPELLTAYELITNLYFLNGDQGQGLRQSLTDLGVKQPSKLLQEFLTRAGECQFSVTEMYQKLEEVDRVRFEMYKFLKNYDVILAPVAATPAKLHSLSHKEWQDFSYTMPYNLTGWPAAVVRIGTSPEALPIGIQVIAKPWHDHVALAVAKKLEEIFGGWRNPYVN